VRNLEGNVGKENSNEKIRESKKSGERMKEGLKWRRRGI